MKVKLDSIAIKLCQQCGIVCIDLAKERIWNDSDFYDYEHMTPSGARKVGEYLYKKLKPMI